MNKGQGRGYAQAPALRRLPQLQGDDLVRLEHHVPGVAVGCDRDAKRRCFRDTLELARKLRANHRCRGANLELLNLPS